MKTNKILIIGISGTGKTRLARQLADCLGIPATHYDELVWQEDWTEVPAEIVEAKTLNVIKRDRWIIEGFISPAADAKLAAADLVIYLDYPGWLAAWGGLNRWWRHRGQTRPELAKGCIEKFNWPYLKVMWHRRERPEIETAIKNYQSKIVRLKSWSNTKAFLAKTFND